jgi:hypothetical protein
MVEKLNDMLKSRYGKGLSIRRLAGVDGGLNQEISLRGDDLYIPIFVKEIFLGYGLIHEARDLSSTDHQHLARLVRMILEPHLYSQHLERTLGNIEIEKATIQTEVGDAPKTQALFLYGTQSHLIQKACLEIHELAGRLSYLPLSAVIGGLNSLSDLQALDESTLVVDLDSSIPVGVQDLLSLFLESALSGPLLLFVGSKAASFLELNLRLKSYLKACEFSVDRLPLDRSAMKEALEMLLAQSEGAEF